MKPLINCACLIHGNLYPWEYVERLYRALQRNLSQPFTLHVYTESSRPVPDHMIKHPLIDWGLSGPKQSWWYKLQLFDINSFSGPLLYFDLDTVIVDRIDWITKLPSNLLWAPRDFKHLWRPNHSGINSSVMWFDTQAFYDIYRGFTKGDIKYTSRRYPGDQDYLNEMLGSHKLRFMDAQLIRSWRWECYNGGFDFRRRTYRSIGAGTDTLGASILVFHGSPKPMDMLNDPVIAEHWC
jgi:hypothetical protein